MSNIINDRECTFVNVLSWVLGLGGVLTMLASPILWALGVIPGLLAWILIGVGYFLQKLGSAASDEVQSYVKGKR